MFTSSSGCTEVTTPWDPRGIGLPSLPGPRRQKGNSPICSNWGDQWWLGVRALKEGWRAATCSLSDLGTWIDPFQPLFPCPRVSLIIIVLLRGTAWEWRKTMHFKQPGKVGLALPLWPPPPSSPASQNFISWLDLPPYSTSFKDKRQFSKSYPAVYSLPCLLGTSLLILLPRPRDT